MADYDISYEFCNMDNDEAKNRVPHENLQYEEDMRKKR
jgi:hypothetical protein